VLFFSLSVTLGWPLWTAVAGAHRLPFGACSWSGWRARSCGAVELWLMATVALGIVLETLLFTFGGSAGVCRAYSHAIGDVAGSDPTPADPSVGWLAHFYLFFQRTRHGEALLAVVQNTSAARLMGIDVERVTTLSFALSGLLAGVAGIMVAPLFTISSTMGTLFGIKAFAVAILGGIGSAWGVVLAGLIYGVAEALVTSLLGSIYTQIVTFALVILSLMVMPNGLFGRAEVRKV
jgi:branched-chain amino acid transport system permease protein